MIPRLRDSWGVRTHPQTPGGISFYLAAIQIPAPESALDTFVTKIIPAGDYLCLSLSGPQPDSDLALIFLYHTFLPKSGLHLAAPLEIERFGERREIMIPVRVPQEEKAFSAKRQK